VLPDSAELAGRAAHVASLPFTVVTLAGLAVALVAWVACRLVDAPVTRRRFLLAQSLGLLAWLVTPVVAVTWVAMLVAVWGLVERGGRHPLALLSVAAIVLAMIVLPVWLVGRLAALGFLHHAIVVFATNVGVLRVIAYVVDRQRGAPALDVDEMLLGAIFFPTMVNGPIEAPHRLAVTWPRPSGRDLSAGLGRIAGGAAKLLVVGLALPPGWTQGLATGPGTPAAALWAWGLLLYAWFYLSFAAWSDVAIGLGRLCGRRVQENFDRPWMAADPADFWRRWHVSLGLWLRDYVYVPLGGNRRARARNVLVTFAVSALWHVWGTLKLFGPTLYPPSAWWGFGVWGLMHGLAVALLPRVQTRVPAVLVAARTATLLFAAWAWMPFFAPANVSLRDGLRVLARMLLPGIL
jgi:D-alanyl-lipoteichoic acid acyltransferase DltB (MBOAT superfamily)